MGMIWLFLFVAFVLALAISYLIAGVKAPSVKLVDCSACGHKMSPEAPKCLKCGATIVTPGDKVAGKVFPIVFICILAGLIVLYLVVSS